MLANNIIVEESDTNDDVSADKGEEENVPFPEDKYRITRPN